MGATHSESVNLPETGTPVRHGEFYPDLHRMTAQIVAAYVAHHHIVVGDLPELIKNIGAALSALMHAESVAKSPEQIVSRKPAVSIRSSITPDAIICLEDGKPFKSLRRHLKTFFGLTPDEYRLKWGLPTDYPMVAPNYAAQRSRLAKDMGLGKRRQSRRTTP